MNILSTTSAAGAYASARRASAYETPADPKTAMIAAALAAVRKPDQALVRAKSAQARNSPMFSAPDSIKAQARAKLEEIRERLKILKKLYAGNPREMARALTQVFKELKAAVKAFKEAGGQELSMSEAAVGEALAPASEPSAKEEPPAREGAAKAADGANPPAPDDTAASDESMIQAQDAATPASEAVEPASPSAAPEASEVRAETLGSGAYREVLAAVRKGIGEDGLEFAKEVRTMSNALSDILEGARVQTLARKPEKKTDEAFRDADDELKSLREDVEKMTREIRQAVPDAGMKLSMTA